MPGTDHDCSTDVLRGVIAGVAAAIVEGGPLAGKVIADLVNEHGYDEVITGFFWITGYALGDACQRSGETPLELLQRIAFTIEAENERDA